MKRFDLQDSLLLTGVLSLETGVAAIYWPAALILLGLLCLGGVLLIERARKAKEKNGPAKP
jgi:hypothetical protein